MKEKLKKQKGITLIALVITIIILLILAMVSVKIVMSGGIITHAQSAKNDYKKAQELERVNLSVTDAKIANNGGVITKENLDEALKKEFGENNYSLTGDDAPFTVTVTNGTGIEYIIYEDGELEELNNEEPQDIKKLYDEGKIKIGTEIKFDDSENLCNYTNQYPEDELTMGGDKVVDHINTGWAILKEENGSIYIMSRGVPLRYEPTPKTNNNVNDINQFVSAHYKSLNFIEEARIPQIEEWKEVKNKIPVGINIYFAANYKNSSGYWGVGDGNSDLGQSSDWTISCRVVLKLKEDVKAQKVVEGEEEYWQIIYE